MKIIVVIDTNRIDNTSYRHARPGGEFETITNYITDNKLEKDITLGIPETVIREIFRHKKDEYVGDISTLISTSHKIDGIKDHKITLSIPDKEPFLKDLNARLKTEFNKYNFVKILSLASSKKAQALDTVIENCDENQKRLNDQLIIEEVKHYKYLGNYNRVILYTDNAKDFEAYLPKEIELFTEWEKLRDSLDAIYLIGDTEEETKFKRFVRTDYAKEQMEDTYFSGTYSTIKVQEILSCDIISDTEAKHGEKYAVIVKAFNNQYKREEKITFLYDNTNTIIQFDLTYQ